MRKRKVLVLFSPEPDVASSLGFVLRIRLRLEIISVSTQSEAQAALLRHEEEPSGVLLLCLASPSSGNSLNSIVSLTRKANCPTLVLDPHGLLSRASLGLAIRHLTHESSRIAYVLSALCAMAQRKRGPKPRYPAPAATIPVGYSRPPDPFAPAVASSRAHLHPSLEPGAGGSHESAFPAATG
jgi:hypothetical protein